MKLPWDPRLRELVALAVLAAFGCGLALSQGDLLFVAIFGAAVRSDNYRGDTTFTMRYRSPGRDRALPDLCLGIVSGRLGHLDP